MTNLTKQERIIRFLTIGLGFHEVPSPSRKYRKFIKDERPELVPYWIGRAGAVRAGNTSSNSISLSDTIEANMKLWETRKGLNG